MRSLKSVKNNIIYIIKIFKDQTSVIEAQDAIYEQSILYL